MAGEGLAEDRNLEDILFSIVGFKEDMVDGHKYHVVVRSGTDYRTKITIASYLISS